MKLRILDRKQLTILGGEAGIGGNDGPVTVEIEKPNAEAGIGGNDGPVTVEIEKPNAAGNQEESGEHSELFLLLHDAFLR